MKDWISLFTPLAVLFLGVTVSIYGVQTLSSNNYHSVSSSTWCFNASDLLELKAKEGRKTEVTQLPILSGNKSPFYYESQKAIRVTVPKDTESLPELKLTMILSIGNSKKFCRINGNLYEEGESGPNFKVLNILHDRVQVVGEDRDIIIIRINK